jgi:hypothetical protein
MKATFLLAVIAMVSPVYSEPVPSVVRFANNDQLSGSLVSLSPERLIWSSPILDKPTSFYLKSVLDLTLSADQPKIEAKHEATLRLTNGDSIRGQLASASDEAVELDTWFAGRMKFRRVMISDVRIDERPQLVYEGPSSLDGWTPSDSPSAWTYQDLSFRASSSGGIARNVNLPDECSIAFDAAWRGPFGLKVAFFSDDLEKDSPESGYAMNFQTRSISLQTGKNQLSLGRPVSAVPLQENEKAHIEIRASAKTGQIVLLVDGKTIALWKDIEVATNKIGRGIHFVASNNSPVKISSIKVGAWDGLVDEMPAPQAVGGFRQFGIQDMQDEPNESAEEKPKEGRMLLRNGDSVVGEVVSIGQDLITIKTPFREVRLPVESLKTLALKPVELERCKRENGDVRGWFPDGSSIVFRLEAVGPDTLTGTNQNFGTAQFKTAAFSRIEFNIYNPKLQELRDTGSW